MTHYAKEHRNELDKIANSIVYANSLPPDFSAMLLKDYMYIEDDYKEKLLKIPEFYTWLRTKGKLLNGNIWNAEKGTYKKIVIFENAIVVFASVFRTAFDAYEVFARCRTRDRCDGRGIYLFRREVFKRTFWRRTRLRSYAQNSSRRVKALFPRRRERFFIINHLRSRERIQ